MTNTIQTDNALLVTVPSGECHAFAMNGNILMGSTAHTSYYYEDGKPMGIDEVSEDWSEIETLPPGEYEILGLADQLTEEQAALVVSRFPVLGHKMFKDYSKENAGMHDYVHDNAINSFLSLVALHNLNPQTTLVLKRK